MLFKSRYSKVVEIINQEITNIEYNVKVGGKRDYAFKTSHNNKKILSVISYNGTFHIPSYTIGTVEKISIFPNSIIMLCDNNKIKDIETVTRILMSHVVKSLNYGVVPTDDFDGIFQYFKIDKPNLNYKY